jgi:UDP-N-acetylmuramoyl-tripeptide--D-alanyl-D-alanine ligase
MSILSPEQVALWAGGQWTAMPKHPICGVSHDTRTIQPGQLYIALCGEHYDGHAFVNEAFDKGAVAAIVNHQHSSEDQCCVVVQDTQKALLNLARAYRKTLLSHFMGITGSVGKTTVKEMIAQIISSENVIYKNPGNWNNHIGLPLSLLNMNASKRYGIFEAGMNHPGELAPLFDCLSPHWGVITSIGPVHIEFFSSIQDIAEEKATLLKVLPKNGRAFLHQDDLWFQFLKNKATCNVVTVSMKGNADYVAQKIEKMRGSISFEVVERKTRETYLYTINRPGDYMVLNALLAIAVSRELHIEPTKIRHALKNYSPLPMRWTEESMNGILFINDSYNANPLSMHASINAFAELSEYQRKFLVLGGMWELGDQTLKEHVGLGRDVGRLPWDGIIVMGELGEMIAEGFIQAGFSANKICYCQHSSEAVEILADRLQKGDAVLLKGSRGEHLEDILKQYKDHSFVESGC